MISLVEVAKAKGDGTVSNRKVAQQLGVARNTINLAVRRIEQSGLSFIDASMMSEEALRKYTSGEKRVDDSILMPDFDSLMLRYRKGATRHELYNNYIVSCVTVGKKPYGTTQFYEHFNDYLQKHPEMLKKRLKASGNVLWQKAKVQSNCHIEFRGNYYSIPYQYIGKDVELCIGNRELIAYYGGVEVARHELLSEDAKGYYCTDTDHLPPDSAHYGEWNSTRYLSWASSIGPYTHELIKRIFDTADIEQRRYRGVHAILRLSGMHGNERLEQACKRALSSSPKPNYKNVKKALEETK